MTCPSRGASSRCDAIRSPTFLFYYHYHPVVSQVDATRHKDLAIKYGIQGFPTMKLFRHGTTLDYGGVRTAEAIVEYMIKKSGPPVTTLTTLADAEAFLANHTKAAIGFYEDVETGAGKAFWKYALKHDFLPFAVTQAQDVIVSGHNQCNVWEI